MANNNGAIGVMGVLVGAVIVIVVSAGIFCGRRDWLKIIDSEARTAEGHDWR